MKNQTIIVVLMLLLGVSACSSGGDDGPITPTGPDTAAEYTDRGWDRFGVRNYDDALADFNEALTLDATYGEAMAGQGWCGLKTATSEGELAAAVASLQNALSAGEGESYVMAGLATLRLAQGGDQLDTALANAATVLSSDPSFVFSHQNSFNAVDMRLVRAFAYALQGNASLALAEADLITDSGIDESIPSTWTVSGTDYVNFTAAVMAQLHHLSEQHAG